MPPANDFGLTHAMTLLGDYVARPGSSARVTFLGRDAVTGFRCTLDAGGFVVNGTGADLALAVESCFAALRAL